MGRGGGGSRSSGGHHSSSRSSGGRMSSGRSSGRGGGSGYRSSFSSGGSRGPSGFGTGPRRPSGFGTGPRRPYGFGIGPHRPGFYSPGFGYGCFSLIIIIIMIWFLLGMGTFSLLTGNNASYGSSNSQSYSVTKSTVKREALPKGSVNETGYYTDELGWIYKSSVLEEGMKSFYNKTGVQPYLYLTDTINGTHTPDEDDMDSFAQEKYDELFTDEAHILIVFHEYERNGYSIWYTVGNQARAVMDEEACNILLDYLDKYYYYDYEDEEYFSQAFHDAGVRIMKVTHSAWLYVAVIALIAVIIFLLFTWWKKAKQQKNLEAEQTERILNTPLETFGDSAIDDLMKKYDD